MVARASPSRRYTTRLQLQSVQAEDEHPVDKFVYWQSDAQSLATIAQLGYCCPDRSLQLVRRR